MISLRKSHPDFIYLIHVLVCFYLSYILHVNIKWKMTFLYKCSWNGLETVRFRQFHLDVSILRATKTTAVERTRCYTDNTTAPYLPSTTIDIPCKETARYVIVETTYDAPEDDPITGAVLEICEIEVYGIYIY